MDNNIAISLDNISKKYKIYNKPQDRLKEALWWVALRRRKLYYRDFWALRDINLEIPKGTTFGIIGQNGSGKSTLLQIIASILQPTTGTFKVNGRISVLLELGAGFNKEFTGRENVFMQGAVMGISRKEMEERFDQITDFADIGVFIDQPVKTYSSGMYIRLAFAVAINVDPDILIVDEALAVGDAMFQRRCYRKIEEFQDSGKTIVFVSHAMQTVLTLCSQTMLLNNGKIIQIGRSKDVVNTYTQLLKTAEEEYLKRLKGAKKEIKIMSQDEGKSDDRLQIPENSKEGVREFRIGSGDAEIVDVMILNRAGESITTLEKGEEYTVKFVAHIKKDIEKPVVGMHISTLTGVNITGALSPELKPIEKGNILTAVFKIKMAFSPGVYALGVGVAEDISTHRRPLDVRRDIMTFSVYGEKTQGLVDIDISIDTSVESEKTTLVQE